MYVCTPSSLRVSLEQWFSTFAVVVDVAVYFILSRLLFLAFSANLDVLYMPHPGMEPLI